jgi:hypothetical protein
MAITIANAAAKIINTAGGIVADGHDIAGGYFVTDISPVGKLIKDSEESKASPNTPTHNIPAYAFIEGALCYCTEDNEFYQYDGTEWKIKKFGVNTDATQSAAGLMSIDDKKKLDGIILSSSGKLDDSIIPAVAITDTYEADSEEAMLALEAQKGDICVRSDLNKSFVLSVVPATSLDNWKELKTPTDAVLSVNGKTGAVNIEPSDIGLIYTNETPTLEAIGGIKKGQTFKDVSIQDMLTMILYKYIEISVGSVSTNPSSTTCNLPNLPTLNSVSVAVTKNSATNLSFEL